jgi:hypothetical protein
MDTDENPKAEFPKSEEAKTLTRIPPISTNSLTVPFCRHCCVAANCLSSVAVLRRMECSPLLEKTSLGLNAAVMGVEKF